MGTPLTPEQRRLRAQIAAHSLHAQQDPKVTTAPARAAFRHRFELQADPDGVLSADERRRRADQLMRAHMARLSLKSSRARQRTKGAA